ncbi:methyltransferase domain-containing protein [Stenotrophomonas maltophilia]|nr:methyltransferase domain-containing protein [Stenotrophomonas maltophilia]
MNTRNRDYWINRSGDLYADQQKIRREAGNSNYARQEAWLVGFLAERSEQLGRPVRVLDFGVGFGRLARLLPQHAFVDYFGFDISPAMVEPLLREPPVELAADIERRIRVGSSLAEAMQGEQFDVIFTVSVLIHNDREQAADVLAQMRALLAPEGRLCFIENRPVSISLLANLWHAGCWSHDFAGTLAPDMNVDVEDGILSDHAIYILHESAAGIPRQLRVSGARGFEPITAGDYLLRTLEATTAVARGMEVESATLGGDIAQMRDAVELYRQAEEHARTNLDIARQHLGDDVGLLDGIGHLTAAIDALPALAMRIGVLGGETSVQHAQSLERIEALHAREATLVESLAQQERELEQVQARLDAAQSANQHLQWQQGLREQVRQVLSSRMDEGAMPYLDAPVGGSASVGQPVPSVYEFNARRDMRFAQTVVGHERVCHIMHQEWFGIRAACGSLPGHKLAVTSTSAPDAGDVEEVARLLAANKVNRLVIHGFSDGMLQWVKGLAAAGFDRIYMVWHGAPSMWIHAEERRLFALAYKAVRTGLIRRVSVMRAGSHAALADVAGWQRQVYNMPPAYTGKRIPRRATGATVFIPSWNLIHKNIFTNAAAAAATGEVANIWLMADDFALPYRVDKNVKRLPKLSQLQMMEAMSQADAVMNASIVDCHPMVELEALAAGTPALRGRLGMDALEDHPYVEITQVADPLSVADVRQTLRRMLAAPAVEMDDMMSSYSRQMVALSFERYSEFMEI